VSLEERWIPLKGRKGRRRVREGYKGDFSVFPSNVKQRPNEGAEFLNLYDLGVKLANKIIYGPLF